MANLSDNQSDRPNMLCVYSAVASGVIYGQPLKLKDFQNAAARSERGQKVTKRPENVNYQQKKKKKRKKEREKKS